MTPEEKLHEKKQWDTFQDEKKLSLSEIISKRFKHKIKVNEATNPSEIEKMIIRPPEAANEQLAFLNDNKADTWSEMFGTQQRKLTDQMAAYMHYKQKRLMSLAKRVRDSFPFSSPEASPTDLLTQVHTGSIATGDEPTSLAQTKSSRRGEKSKSSLKKMQMTEYANYNKKANGGNTRNIILLCCVIFQVLACCTLGFLCMPRCAIFTKLEYNGREHELKKEKVKFIREVAR